MSLATALKLGNEESIKSFRKIQTMLCSGSVSDTKPKFSTPVFGLIQKTMMWFLYPKEKACIEGFVNLEWMPPEKRILMEDTGSMNLKV